jgi:hypothetical protein
MSEFKMGSSVRKFQAPTFRGGLGKEGVVPSVGVIASWNITFPGKGARPLFRPEFRSGRGPAVAWKRGKYCTYSTCPGVAEPVVVQVPDIRRKPHCGAGRMTCLPGGGSCGKLRLAQERHTRSNTGQP